jgi:hypothetical protein
MTGEARDLFAKFVADGDVGAFAEDLPTLLAKSFSPTMQTLRDKNFQRLLADYPRGQRTFIVAPTVTDTVGSELADPRRRWEAVQARRLHHGVLRLRPRQRGRDRRARDPAVST